MRHLGVSIALVRLHCAVELLQIIPSSLKDTSGGVVGWLDFEIGSPFISLADLLLLPL